MRSKGNDWLLKVSKVIIIIGICIIVAGCVESVFFMAETAINAQRNSEYVLEEVADDEYTLEEVEEKND